jgi:hypothetical protein
VQTFICSRFRLANDEECHQPPARCRRWRREALPPTGIRVPDGHGWEWGTGRVNERRDEWIRRRRRLSFGGEGKPVHTEVRWPPIRLQVGHGRRLAYKMVYFKQVQNCNGTSAVTWIVMVSFQNRANSNGTDPINPLKKWFSAWCVHLKFWL